MSYVKQTWEDLPSQNTPITAARLNHMEDGIKGGNDLADNLNTSIGDLTELETTDKANVVNAINENVNNLSKFGKTLWEGSFSTGTLTIPHLNEYSVICIWTSNLMMIGNQYYGGGVLRAYRGTAIGTWGYRFTYDATNNTLTTDTDNPGASNGTDQLTIRKIVGVF